PVGHFNIFPLSVDAPPYNYRVENWGQLHEALPLRNKIVILNHANDIHNNFRPFDQSRHISIAGVERDDWTFPANAMEVMNSGSQQSDVMKLFEQWFGMLNGGQVITPVGASDSHDVSRYIVGQGRTYLRMKNQDPSK